MLLVENEVNIIIMDEYKTEINDDNTTSLVFGNGVLKDGNLVDDNYIDREQIGIIIPGQTNDLNSSIDPVRNTAGSPALGVMKL